MAGVAYGYDDNGNLTSDGSNAYVYDAENRLVSSTLSGGTTLVYDPLGRLWQVSGGQHGTTRFVYDGDHVAVEYDGAGAVRRRFVWAPGADRPLLQAEGATLDCATARFLHADHQGSIVATANCPGARLAVNSYDEYGIPAPTNWGRFQYTGQAWLPELGMYYYKARIYAPQIGRFLQTDPIGYEDQVNLYAYVGNDPVNLVDPSGTCTGSLIENKNGTCKLSENFTSSLGVCAGNCTVPAGQVEVSDGQGQFSRDRVGDGSGTGDAQQMEHAVRAALEKACRCSFSRGATAPLNDQFARALDRSKLPNVFDRQVRSVHSERAYETSPIARLGSGPFSLTIVVKLYIGDRDNGGLDTLAVSSMTNSFRHLFDGALYKITGGETVANKFYARQFCYTTRAC